MKSLSATVETPETVGTAAVAVHALTPVFGSPAVGSKGVVVSAPDIPNAIPDAAVGVADIITVTVSAVSAVAAVPYHSMLVDRWVPEQDVKELRAEPCHVTLPSVSDTELTVIADPER